MSHGRPWTDVLAQGPLGGAQHLGVQVLQVLSSSQHLKKREDTHYYLVYRCSNIFSAPAVQRRRTHYC
jgi:hypothetical protein